jgi:catechol 2,3-dioxygenase-like lactoylglutathione lyase family enzyme
VRVSYAIVFVSDMARSASFYGEVLGLPMGFSSPDWTEFATDGATLALHLAGATAKDLEALPAGRCRPGFRVPDLADFHRRLVERQVTCVQEPTPVFGHLVAQYADPDGLVISVGEEPRRP